MAKHLRFIAERIAADTPRFALVIRAAAKEISELRWENGVMRRKLNLKAKKHNDDPLRGGDGH